MNYLAPGKHQRCLRPGFGLVLIVGAMVLGGACSVGTAGEDTKRRPEVVVYYPHWHSYDHGSAWKGEGWTEWEGVKAAVPRFPGHEQPLKPTWGYFDESDPQWSAREIALAADHGIDVFLYDWYNVNTTGKAGPDLIEQYEDLMQLHRDHWQKMTAESPLVNLPVVTTGWDVTPRCRRTCPGPSPWRRRAESTNIPTVRSWSAARPSGSSNCCAMWFGTWTRTRVSRLPCSSMPGTNGRRAAFCCPKSGRAPPAWRLSNGSSGP